MEREHRMPRLRVGVIGTGHKKERPDLTGFFMAYSHAPGYLALPDRCTLVACADIVPENAQAFAAAAGIPRDGVYVDYRTMLAEARLDIVSICTWPHLHAGMILDCALAGVKAIHAEKPMAHTWGAARLAAQECERRSVQLTFNHMRRFGKPFTGARDLLKQGVIGDLVRIEVGIPGRHLRHGYALDRPLRLVRGRSAGIWVIGQIDYRVQRFIFGMHSETQAMASWQYSNGVYAVMASGAGADTFRVSHRLIGTDGVIEVGVPDGPLLRVRRDGGAWDAIDTGDETLHGPGYHERGIADAIEALETGREPELSARRALNATEILFAIYQSSRQRGRIDLPLTIDDNPLVSMVESGALNPRPAQ